jgi:hypothetical protein
MMEQETMMPDVAEVIPLADALPPVAMLLGGVPVLTGLVLAAARYVAMGTV